MGAQQSKEELLCQEVQKGNHDAVKALRRDGTSLEWVDKKGRTPLILACTRGELLDMAITLLNLGANINAYRPGTHGGFPIHHAAKRGLEKTVTLLLSHGASPLAINDDGQTPLDMARSRGHVSVVRLLEEQVSLFSGMLRELSGPAILETLAPSWVTKKIWAVVLPIESNPRRDTKFELAIYQSPKVNLWSGIRPSSSHPSGLCNVAQPRTIIQLAKVEVEEPRIGSRETVLHITDKTSKTKYKFLPGDEGNKAQLESLYKACNGIPQVQVGVPSLIHQEFPSPTYQHNNPSQIHPMILHQSGPLSPASQTASAPSSNISSPRKLQLPSPVVIPEDVALAIAVDASIRSAKEEGIPVSPTIQKSARMTDYSGWGDVSVRSYNSWGLPDPQKPPKENSYNGWDEGEDRSTYDGWGQAEAGPSRLKVASADIHSEIPATQTSLVSRKEEKITSKLQSAVTNQTAPPSAPPLPSIPAVVGQIRYPSIDTSSVRMSSSIQHDESISKGDKKGEDKVSGLCVVCWDAPVEGACIPCGHLAGCMSCLSEVKGKNWGCPVCRAAIEQVVKVYAV